MWPLENVPSYICSEKWKPQWGRESAGRGTARCCLREASAAKPAQEPNSQMTSAEVLQVLFLGFLDYQLLSARTTTNPTEMKCQPQGGLDPLCSHAACPRLHHGAAVSGSDRRTQGCLTDKSGCSRIKTENKAPKTFLRRRSLCVLENDRRDLAHKQNSRLRRYRCRRWWRRQSLPAGCSAAVSVTTETVQHCRRVPDGRLKYTRAGVRGAHARDDWGSVNLPVDTVLRVKASWLSDDQ